MSDPSILPALPATGPANAPPPGSITVGQPIPETDPAYLLFAAGQGYREQEARAYTALRQNAIHQAFQDQLPGMILQGQQTALATTKNYADNGAWRTGARVQEQARNASDLQSKITAANNAQQSQQDDLAAQLADHIANLNMDTSQAALQARENSALSTAAMGQQAFVNGTTMNSANAIPANLLPGNGVTSSPYTAPGATPPTSSATPGANNPPAPSSPDTGNISITNSDSRSTPGVSATQGRI
jgi:hypothetical protein